MKKSPSLNQHPYLSLQKMFFMFLFFGNIFMLRSLLCQATGTESWLTVMGAPDDNEDDNDYIFSVQETLDGSYIFAGETDTYDPGGSGHAFIVKLDSSGRPSWAKTLGSLYGDSARAIQQTLDEGYVLIGTTLILGVDNDVLIAKLTEAGDLSWAKALEWTGSDRGYFIQEISDGGGYALVGSTPSYGAGGYDALIVKLDSNGTYIWGKALGGLENDYGYGIQITSDGSFMLTGYTSSYGAGDTDGLIAKFGSSGSLSWAKTFGESDADEFHSIQETSDGGYLLVGLTASYGVGTQILIAKIDSSGTLSWAKILGGSDSSDVAVGDSIQETSDGGYILTGFTSFGAGGNDILIAKIDSSGNLSWVKTLGGAPNGDVGYSIQETSDGGYVLAGSVYYGGELFTSALALKLTSDGDLASSDLPSSLTFTDQTSEFTLETISLTVSSQSPTITTISSATTDITSSISLSTIDLGISWLSTSSPTQAPTANPSQSPTRSPTSVPTTQPTPSPTHTPTNVPTGGPTSSPTHAPTFGPTSSPTNIPSQSPTFNPTQTPSQSPTPNPTNSPTPHPTAIHVPSSNPTIAPTRYPTPAPTKQPTFDPTHSPTNSPTPHPTVAHVPSPSPVPYPVHNNTNTTDDDEHDIAIPLSTSWIISYIATVSAMLAWCAFCCMSMERIKVKNETDILLNPARSSDFKNIVFSKIRELVPRMLEINKIISKNTNDNGISQLGVLIDILNPANIEAKKLTLRDQLEKNMFSAPERTNLYKAIRCISLLCNTILDEDLFPGSDTINACLMGIETLIACENGLKIKSKLRLELLQEAQSLLLFLPGRNPSTLMQVGYSLKETHAYLKNTCGSIITYFLYIISLASIISGSVVSSKIKTFNPEILLPSVIFFLLSVMCCFVGWQKLEGYNTRKEIIDRLINDLLPELNQAEERRNGVEVQTPEEDLEEETEPRSTRHLLSNSYFSQYRRGELENNDGIEMNQNEATFTL